MPPETPSSPNSLVRNPADGGFSPRIPGRWAAVAIFAVLGVFVVLLAVAADPSSEPATVTLRPAPGGSDHPTLTVDPATELVDHQIVTVHGEGFDPAAAVMIEQCRAAEPGNCASDFSEIDDDGSFTLDVGVSAAHCDGHPFECLQVQALDQSTLEYHRIGGVFLGWAEDWKPVTPSAVTASPLTGLADGDAILVSADGRRPGDPFDAVVCPSPEPITEECLSIAQSGISDRVDRQGRLREAYRATALLGSGDGAIDCRVQQCYLHVDPNDDPTTFALEFDPDAPLAPPPTASARLHEGRTLEVAGEGFVPAEEVYATTCIKRDGPRQCLFPTTVHATAGEDGSVAIAYEPEPFEGFAGVQDCRGAECFVLVWGSAPGVPDGRDARAPFALDP